MKIDDLLLENFYREASSSEIGQIWIGLGYTVVTLSDNRAGLCHTQKEAETTCTLFKEVEDFEGKKALSLLEKIRSPDTITRSVVLALINALNHSFASSCPDDKDTLFEDLRLREGSKVAMVGYFGPVVRRLEARNVEVRSYDIGKGVGEADGFYGWAREEADALILTATSLINRSTEEVFRRMGSRGIPAVLMGPSTVLHPPAYRHLPISILAGTVPTDLAGTLKAIRNGKGTPELLKHARKVYLKL